MGKKHLTPFGKKFFSFLAAGTFFGSSAALVHNENKKIENNTNTVIESLEDYKTSFNDNPTFQIIEPRDSSGKHHSHNFDFMEVISQLEKSIPIFYKYNSSLHLIKTAEQKTEYEKAMKTIYDLNISFVEIENMKIKEEIAPELNVSPEQLDILYELNNRYDVGRVSISVNGDSKSYTLSNELEEKIKKYKKNILLTQGISFNSLNSIEKQDVVTKILNNISSSRNDIIEYCKNNNIKIENKNISTVPDNQAEFSVGEQDILNNEITR